MGRHADGEEEGADELRRRTRRQAAVATLSEAALAGGDLDELLAATASQVADALGAERAGVLEVRSRDEREVPSGAALGTAGGAAGAADGDVDGSADGEFDGSADGEPDCASDGAAGGTPDDPDEESPRELVLRSCEGWPDDADAATVAPASGTLLAASTDASTPVVAADLGTDGRYDASALLADADVATGLGAAIRVDGDLWGVLVAYAGEPGAFDGDDVAFLERVAGVVGSAIEQRRRRRDLELFRRLLDRATDAVFVVDPEDGGFLDVNDVACRRLGYDREELLALSVPDVEVELPDPDAWRDHVAAVRESGMLTFEGSHRRADGSTFPVEVNVTVVELDREYAVAVARDVTERRERQRELEAFRALTEAANDAIVTIDAESTIRRANEAVEDVFGYDPDELVGERLTVLMDDEVAEQHLAAVDRYLETGERQLDWDYVELTGRRADGSTVPLAVSFSEAEFEGERYFTGVMRDISERRSYERRLEASNERLEQFAHAASHDLKEPLRTVASHLHLLEREVGDDLDADAREYLDGAVDGAERMQGMVEGLLEYARVETEGADLEPVDLEAVVAAAREDLAVRLEEADADLEVEPLPTVLGDRDQLRQVFLNLLDNAVAYSGEAPPRIHVAAEGVSGADGDRWRVSVSDEGVGIDPEDAEEVFEVFERRHAAEEGGGSGIGLALVRRIVRRHGGEVWVDSEPGEGSTFHFTLPAVEGEDARTEGA